MTAFADRTGIASAASPRRYLWTDAFALGNFLALHSSTGEPRWREYARVLIEQVHHILGRHRPDDVRSGWISGLNEAAASNYWRIAYWQAAAGAQPCTAFRFAPRMGA